MSITKRYNEAITSAVVAQNGIALRDLLLLSSKFGAQAMYEYMTSDRSLPSFISHPWSSLSHIVHERHSSAAAITARSWDEAYTHLHACISNFLKNVLPSCSAWPLPLLYGLLNDLRDVAEQADEELVAGGVKAGNMDDCAMLLTLAFRITSNEANRPEKDMSKKVGALQCANQLFRVYFSKHTLHLCSKLTTYFDHPSSPPFETTYPIAHRVTYNYYQGRLHLYEENFDSAIASLSSALSCTPMAYFSNRRRILLYLIPAKMLRGFFPSPSTILRYSMHWYIPIIRAVCAGDMPAFDGAVASGEKFFFRKGIYCTLQKLRPLIYRNLIQKLYRTREVTPESERCNIPYRDILVCLAMRGMKMEEEKLKRIIACLLTGRLIKGEFSPSETFLALEKDTPFPAIASP